MGALARSPFVLALKPGQRMFGPIPAETLLSFSGKKTVPVFPGYAEETHWEVNKQAAMLFLTTGGLRPDGTDVGQTASQEKVHGPGSSFVRAGNMSRTTRLPGRHGPVTADGFVCDCGNLHHRTDR